LIILLSHNDKGFILARFELFNDKEFQALEEPRRRKILDNFFDEVLSDDSFTKLPKQKQQLIRDNFFLSQTTGSVSTGSKYAINNNPPAPMVDESGNVVADKSTIEPIEETPPSETIDIAPINSVVSEDVTTTKPLDAIDLKQKDEKSLLEKSKELLFGNGESYENPDADAMSEVGKRVVNRTNELTSNAIQSTYKLLDFFTTSPLEHLGLQTDSQKESKKIKSEWFDKASDNLNNFIYEKNKMQINDAKKPTHDWKEVKKAFNAGGVFDVDSWQEVGNYIASEGVASVPDMAEMVGALPLYFASRVQESAEKRAKNEKRKEPSTMDYFNVAPTVMGSVMLDRFGLKGITEDVVEKVGKTALDGTLKDTVGMIGKEMKNGVIKEGGTEAVQNPLEQFGEEQGTQHGLSSLAEYGDIALSGFVAGAGMGAGMSGVTATGTEAFNSYTKAKQEKQRDAFIQEAYNKDMLGSGLVASVDDKGYVNFKNQLDTKVKKVQSDFENLIINNPDVKVPVEAVDNIVVQEQVVKQAQDDGLDVSDNNGLNAIDKGFKELESEIGGVEDVQPKASEEATTNEDVTLSDISRMKELEAKPDDELTLDEKFELEDLQTNVAQLQELGSDELTSGDKDVLDAVTEPQQKEPMLQDDALANEPTKQSVAYEDSDAFKKSQKIFTKFVADEKTQPYDLNEAFKEFWTTNKGQSLNDFKTYFDKNKENFKKSPIPKKKKPLNARAEALQEASVVPIGGSEDETAEAVKRLMNEKSLDSDIKSYNKADIEELDKEHLRNKYHPVEVNNAYDFLSTTTKKNPTKQGTLAGLEPQGQNALFDTTASEEYVTPSWAKDIVSDTTPYSSVIKALTDAKNGEPSELSDRAMQALHKAGDPHLDKEVNRFNELSKRWDLNPLEESEASELARVLNNYLQGEEDGTLGKRENSQTKTDTGTSQNATEDNGALQTLHEQGIHEGTSTKESDSSLSNSEPIQKPLVFNTEKTYSTKGINEEYPSRKISKQIQKDVAKYVGQLAKATGYDFALNSKGKKLTYNGVSDNIAPAGGEVNFTLYKPNSDVGIFVSLNYEPNYSDSEYDNYQLQDGFHGHLYRTVSKSSGKSGNNHFVKSDDLTSSNFINDIINLVDKQEGKDNASKNRSSSETNRASDTVGVPTEKQSTPDTRADTKSGATVPNSDRRPDGLSENGSNTDAVPNVHEGVVGHTTSHENQSNEQQSTNADTVLPKPDERHSTEKYSLEGKDPVELTKGQRKKFNKASLDIIKKPLNEITEADREILRHYTGEGGLDTVSENSVNQHYTNYATVSAMYNALKEAGVPMGKALEPAVGSGNFVGFNPDANWDVVDIDTNNIEVTKRLYPQIKNFHAESFETFKGKNYDLIISNVPFASEQMLMREHAMTIKPAFKAIHNFYFAHSIDKVKDNGVVAFMTSTGTMDGTTTAKVLRKYLMDRGDIIGAYRLPEKSQAKNAHTDTMIDIIFIQKRPAGVESRQKDINNQFVNIGSKGGHAMNEYFIAHPENLLGDEVVIGKDKTKMGKEGWIVKGEPLFENIKVNYEPYKAIKKEKKEENSFNDISDAVSYAKEHGLEIATSLDDMKVHSVINDDTIVFYDKPLHFKETEAHAMFGKSLKGVNANKALHLNRIMTLTEDALHQENKNLLNTALNEIESYKEIYKKSPHNDLSFKKWMKEHRLELKAKEYMSYFDKDFNPAPVYGEKTRFKDSGELQINEKSPLTDKALFYSTGDSVLDTSKSYEFLSANEMQQLEAEGAFVRSGESEIQLAFMYYSGNVYKKLDNLEVMASNGVISKEAYATQHKNLQEIVPPAIPFKAIKVKGGESWLPQAIKSKLLKTQTKELSVNPEVFDGKYDYVELYNRYLNKKALAPKSKDESDGENIQRTMEAEEKLTTKIIPAVMQFIEKEGLDEMLTDEYNRHANFYVRPTMSGVLLRDMPKSFRGKPFKMQSHQAEGAEKIVFNKKGVLAFAPGGGKTITAVVAVKNLLEQGVMKKPLFVVPVNTIAQWEETIKELYPDASVFEFPKIKSGKNKGNAKEWSQLSKDEKEQMAFDLANNRYDFTIIGDTMFQKFGLPREVLSDYVDDLVNQMVSEEEAQEGSSKKKQKELVSAENKRQALKNGLRAIYGGDVEFDFAKLGFDGLIADEVQYYKNIGIQGSDAKGGLGASTSIKYYDKDNKPISQKDIKKGIQPYGAVLGSMRSYDFRFKSKFVSQNNNGNNVILLTGTPTPNKPLELYTLLQHLDENILKEYGIESSKDFVDTFYDLENYETTDSTGKIVKREGLASMKNLEWLQKILDRYVDYKGFEDMPDLPRPKQVDVQHYLKLSKAGEVIFGDVQHRILKAIEDSKRVKSGKELPENVEIPLVSMGAGRSASIDLRLYDIGTKGKSTLSKSELDQLIAEDVATTENNKILKTVELVSEQYKKNSNSGQIIFLDRLTVKNADGSTTSTHQEIRNQVLESGLFDENEVVFVNGGEYVNPTTGKVTKGSIKPDMLNKIMDMYNDGKIKVIIGNTSKLGVGVDLNRKTTDIYQLDIPFRPDEIEQRSNRGVRQGNENAEVRVHQFFQLGTFDRRSYDIVLAKRGFNDIYGFTDNSDVNIEDGVSTISNKDTTDPYQAVIDLESDPFERERLRKQRSIDNAVVDANNLKNLVEKLKKDIELKKSSIKNYTEAIAGIDKNLKAENLPKYESLKDEAEKAQKLEKFVNGLKERKAKYFNTIKEYEADIKDTEVKLSEREKQQSEQIANTKFITDEFTHDGKNVSLDKIKEAYTEQQILEDESKESESDDAQSAMLSPLVAKPVVSAKEELKAKSKANIQNKEVARTESTNNYARANGYDEAGANYVAPYSFDGLPERPADGYYYIGARTIALPTIDEPINADSIRVYLSDVIGNRLYDGKLKGKSALGVYKRSDSAIRVKNYSDVEVMAHEMAHYLDFFYKNPSKKAKDSFFRLAILRNKEEVKALSYTTDPKKVLSEGFAEFVRLYLTNYNTLESVAPNMLADFEVKLASDKVLQKKIDRLQEGMHQFYYQGSAVSIRGKQGGELNSVARKIKRSQKEIGKDIRQKAIDRLHTIKRIEAEIKGDVSADALDSAYKSLQLVNGVSSILHSTMNFGVPVVKKNGDLTYGGKPLNDVLAPVTSQGKERVKLFSDYLVAKRASELKEQGRENLITDSEIEAGLKLEKEFPEFAKVFEEYQEFNDKMLDFYVAMNLITTAQRENFKEMNKNYVPFNRVRESVQNGGVGSATIGKRLTGGTHSLGNIMENIVDGLEANIKEALISRGKTKFYEMLEESGMGGVYATKISSADKLVKSDLEQQAKKVAQIMAELGVTVAKDGQILSGDINSELIVDVNEIEQNLLDNPSALEFWTHGHPPMTDGSSYVDSAIINDKRVYFETKDIGLIDALTSLRGQQHNILVQGLMSIKNIMTWNITNNPLFYLTNFARDTVSAGVLSKNRFIPVLSSVQGMYHFITKSKTYKEFMASGAGYGTRRTSLGGEKQALDMLKVSRGFDVLARVVGAMEYGADVFEYGTRVGDFALAQKAGKSNMQSAYEGREVSTDFAIKGSDTSMSSFMATVPFMKAGIVGIDKTARRVFTISGEMKLSNAVKFKNDLGEIQNHKIKIYATGGMIVGFTLALWFSNRDDDRYKKLTRDEKLMYWHFFVNGEHIKIPRPYDIGFAFSSIPEIIADGIYSKHGEEAVKDFIWSAKTMFSVGDVSGLFQPILEDMTNTNWTGSSIIPRNMQNLDDKSGQYFSTTPQLYKDIGKATGLSPIKMQHYVDGYLGLTAKMVEEATENMLWNKKAWGERPFARDAMEFLTYRFHGKDVTTRTKYTEKYYEIMQKANGVKASYDKKMKEAYKDNGKDIKEYMSSKEHQEYVILSKMLRRVNGNLAQIKASVEHITYDKKLSKAQKESKIKTAYDNKNEELQNITEEIEAQLKKVEGK